jgi:hydrogenase maturation protease
MPRMSVIGIGSPFGDDRAGWMVAELLAGSGQVVADAEQLTVTACRSPGGELPALLAKADIAIVVDAVMNGGAPGTVYRLTDPRLLAFAGDHLSSHGMSLQATLELARALGELPKIVLIYGIEAASAETESVMNDNVLEAIPRVREQIERDIAYYCRR